MVSVKSLLFPIFMAYLHGNCWVEMSATSHCAHEDSKHDTYRVCKADLEEARKLFSCCGTDDERGCRRATGQSEKPHACCFSQECCQPFRATSLPLCSEVRRGETTTCNDLTLSVTSTFGDFSDTQFCGGMQGSGRNISVRNILQQWIHPIVTYQADQAACEVAGNHVGPHEWIAPCQSPSYPDGAPPRTGSEG